jgi:hypothetical protein
MLDAADRIEALEVQLAKAREAALAIHEIGFECVAGPLSFCAEWWALRDALGLHLDTPAPVQPSPDAVVKAALEWAAERADYYAEADYAAMHYAECCGMTASGTAHKIRSELRVLRGNPATIAAIIAQAGKGAGG